jgi:hypothetical protein
MTLKTRTCECNEDKEVQGRRKQGTDGNEGVFILMASSEII